MSKHNHNNHPEQKEEVVVAAPVVEEIVEETVVVEESVAVEEPVTEEKVPETVIGVVTDCVKLNIRKKPNVNAEVLCEVVALSELVIDPDKSNENWFSVCTEAGVEGFCMKKYVIVKE